MIEVLPKMYTNVQARLWAPQFQVFRLEFHPRYVLKPQYLADDFVKSSRVRDLVSPRSMSLRDSGFDMTEEHCRQASTDDVFT